MNTTITATCDFRGQTLSGIPVINPGDSFGRAWLLEIGGSFTPLYFVVEADTVSDAVDILVEDKTHGKHLRIDESAQADYVIHDQDKNLWVDLNGKEYTEDPKLSEVKVTGQGVPFDDDWLAYFGNDGPRHSDSGGYPVTYQGTYEGRPLPANGLSAQDFQTFMNLTSDGWQENESDDKLEDTYVSGFRWQTRSQFSSLRVFRKNGVIDEITPWDGCEEVQGVTVPPVLLEMVKAFLTDPIPA